MRDIGTIMNLSYQRAHQLLTPPGELEAADQVEQLAHDYAELRRAG